MVAPKKIVHLITGLGRGGAERMLALIATHDFGPTAPRQVVISLMDEGVYGPQLRANGVTVYCIGTARRSVSIRSFLRVLSILRKEKPDVLMTWLYHSDLLGLMASPFIGRPKVIWNVRCSNEDTSLYPFLSRVAISVLAWFSRSPWAVVTNSVAGRVAHERLGYRPARWYYLPNGLNLDQYRMDERSAKSVREEFAVPDSSLLVGLIARVDPLKDHANFIRAAERVAQVHPEVVFLLVGTDTESLDIPPALHDRVRVAGERSDVARILSGLDIMVLSSLSEGFPNVVIEAMGCGVPCVVTDVGDAAAVVAGTGVVVPARDPVALADGIETLISAGPDRRRELGCAARERVREFWSLDAAARSYRSLWDDALSTVGETF